MKLVAIEYPETGVCKLTLSADAAELEAGAQAVYERTRANITIKGFEKGQADREQIEAVKGAHEFWYDAINDILDQNVNLINDAVKAENLSVEGEASFDLVSVNKEEGFVVTAMLALTPEVTVGDYTGFTVKCPAFEVTDADVNRYIESQRRGKMELVAHHNRHASKGDTVRISFVGRRDGKPFKGGEGQNVELVLGSGRMIPGFEDQIMGHVAGDEFEIKVPFPERYREQNLAGKEAVFQTTLHEVCVKQLPALDANLVAKLDPNCKTVDEYRKVVYQKLWDNRHGTAMNRARAEILARMTAGVTGNVADLLIEREHSARLEQFQQLLRMQGMTMQSYLQQAKQTADQFDDMMRRAAENTVRMNFGLLKIAEKEGLVPTAEELDQIIAGNAERANKPVEEYAATVNREEMTRRLCAERAREFVLSHSTIEE